MYGKKLKKSKAGVANQHFLNKFYNADKVTQFGVTLCKEMGIDPATMAIKGLKHFFKHGITEDVVKMNYIRYEERRKLKLLMIEEFDSQKSNLGGDTGAYHDHNSFLRARKMSKSQNRVNSGNLAKNPVKRVRKMSEISAISKDVTSQNMGNNEIQIIDEIPGKSRFSNKNTRSFDLHSKFSPQRDYLSVKNLGDPDLRLKKEEARLQRLERVKKNQEEIVKTQATKIAQMMMKNLEKQKRKSRDLQDQKKITTEKILSLQEKKDNIARKRRLQEIQEEGKRYDKYKRDMREVTKRLKMKEEDNLRKNIEDYNSYENKRRAHSTFRLSRTYTDKLDSNSNKVNLSTKKQRLTSNSHYHSRSMNEYQEIEETKEQLRKLDKKIQQSQENRQKILQEKVAPVKDHLNRITKALEIVHSSEHDQLSKKLLKYSKKDKMVNEARKRKKNISQHHYNEKEQELSKAFYENRQRLETEEREKINSLNKLMRKKMKSVDLAKQRIEEESKQKAQLRQQKESQVQDSAKKEKTRIKMGAMRIITKHLKPNPKQYQADVMKQVNDIIIRNDMKHRENMVHQSGNYVDAYVNSIKKSRRTQSNSNKFTKYGNEFGILEVLPDVRKKSKEDEV
ncbi:unnamed protein product [Moneuplotes crassus]|uniref:Uncharacterized protein n=2 Tax=Euplotes crassus TaxID=5936 RepID=A0AAD1U2P5_EUPCR|nr:unnamed protein product [Moneuplotes crassus]